MKKKNLDCDFNAMMDYQNLSPGDKLAILSPNHCYPPMHVLGLVKLNEKK